MKPEVNPGTFTAVFDRFKKGLLRATLQRAVAQPNPVSISGGVVMAVCPYCEQEMRRGVGCSVDAFDGEPPRVPNGVEECHDCRTPPHAMHHPGCDMERCSLCGGQAISCKCRHAPQLA